MASDDKTGKDAAAKPTRFFGGPRAIGALLPAITRPAFRSRSAAGAQIMADWAQIVGPALAEATVPRQFAGGTLTIACAGPVALELQHLTGPLAQRINAHFGRTLVERFRFVQGSPPAQRPAASTGFGKPAPPVEIPDMTPSDLRDALGALGAAIARARSRDSA